MIPYRPPQFKFSRTIPTPKRPYKMVDIEIFTHIFLLLDNTDKVIIKNYIEGLSIKAIAQELDLSPTFVFERIYQFELELEKNIRSKKQ